MVTAKFGDFSFQIDAASMLFGDLKITSECAVDEKTEQEAAYVAKKNGKPVQVNLNAFLNAALGADVRATAMQFEAAARKGQKNKLVIGQEALFPFDLMLVKAEISEVAIAPGGQWVNTKIALTFKQAGLSAAEKSETEGCLFDKISAIRRNWNSTGGSPGASSSFSPSSSATAPDWVKEKIKENAAAIAGKGKTQTTDAVTAARESVSAAAAVSAANRTRNTAKAASSAAAAIKAGAAKVSGASPKVIARAPGAKKK